MVFINEDGYLEIDNVIPILRGNKTIKFLTNISAKELYDVKDIITYDEKTQRGFKTTKIKGVDVEQKIINIDNIKEMKEKIINNEFFDGDTLTWNVRTYENRDLKDFYEYLPDENKLIIKSKYITLPDSAQRTITLTEIAENPNFDASSFYLPLSISLYNLKEEQQLFSEINGKGQRASKTRALYLANTPRTIMLKNVIKHSALRGNVETRLSGVGRRHNIVTFATLYESLFHKQYGAYKNIEDKDLQTLEKWLIRFYNKLIETRKELSLKTYDERTKLNSRSLVANAITFVTYAHMAKELEHDKNWFRRIERLNNIYRYGAFEGDIFDINNPMWHVTVCRKTLTGKYSVVNSNSTAVVAKNQILNYLNIGKNYK